MSSERLNIPQAIYDQMLAHGRTTLPFETCGLLSGNNGNVQSIWKLENELKSDRRFFVGKGIIEETIREIKSLDEQVLAIYHTHPTTAPVPSFYDITNHPDEVVKMVIVSYKTMHPITKCYNICGANHQECLFWLEPSL
ncbi:Mov34/MPN/PAD-1 family protein [Virgibacillus flavescens]|uniref:Mov34/MPN/PAD-1 family protein n=1 Tax=Virgibacillus flavescens TaxID=1611422 RepID=UPI003D34A4BA